MDKDVAIRKRTQIDKANRTMFIWVAGASVVLGFALVGIILLVQMIMFNERVLQEKGVTLTTLKDDNGNISALEANIRALDANKALMEVKAHADDQTLQVVLDALPSNANSLALGASLQNKLLAGVSGLEIESIKVEPVAGVESLDSSSASSSSTTGEPSIASEILFSISVSGPAASLQNVLQNLEKSLRTIDVTSFTMDGQTGGKLSLTLQGRAFYEPAKVVELKDKTVE